MIQEIKPHHTNEEIISMNMQPNIEMLTEKLDFIISEIEFFSDLLSSQFFLNDSKNEEDMRFLFKRLETMREVTMFHNKTTFNFRGKLDRLRECDDMECEIIYVQEFELLKSSLQKHFLEFDKLKEIIHKFISRNLNS